MRQIKVESRNGVYRTVFESSNELGIPDLLPDKLYSDSDQIELAVCGFSKLSSCEVKGKVFGYWTDDFRFEACWNKPRTMLDKILLASPAAMVEPDFSTLDSDPFVLQLQAVYKSRWVGRYWQEYGINIIPNIQWSTLSSLSWSLVGIPRSPPMIAIEGRQRQRKDFSRWLQCVNTVCEILSPQTILLYGATKEMAEGVKADVLVFSAATPRNKQPLLMQRKAYKTPCGETVW
jgi:hypothetical protein